MAAEYPDKNPEPNDGWRSRVAWLGGAAIVVLAVLWIGLAGLRTTSTPQLSPTPPAPPPPQALTLGKGGTIQDTLAAHVSKEAAVQLVHAFRPHLDFRRLKPEDTIELHRDGAGAIVRVVYAQSPLDIFEADWTGDAWRAARREVPVERRVVVVGGTLNNSLFESVEGLGERPQLVMDFAEIFAWDFDFAQDSQPGDTFRMLVEKVYTGDRFVKYGRILAAEYGELGGKVHAGVYFKDKEGGGYYTPAGESLRRSFLKSPLEFTRISSRYTHARRHPVLGGVRPHLAVDYAAPSGTPIWAVADGTVEQAGWSGGGGNTVVIRHRASFKTMYNHLSGFGKGIRPGTVVRQRQVIGYVGSTGLSTGPHLDYRVMKDGKFVNPLKQTFLPGQPIAPASRTAFVQARDTLLQQLRGGPAVAQASPPTRK
jgi:murein DD-endopeptidase MepM/ murein hydrolase activator NlpD